MISETENRKTEKIKLCENSACFFLCGDITRIFTAEKGERRGFTELTTL